MGSCDIDATVSAIRSGPSGPAITAVFDITAVTDAPRRRARFLSSFRHRNLARLLTEASRDKDAKRFLGTAEKLLTGRTEDELVGIGTRLFRRGGYGRIFPEAWRLVAEHRAAGHTVILVGSLTEFQAAPIAAALGIQHLLCTRMAVSHGKLTGKPAGVPLFGNDKAEAVIEFGKANELDIPRGYLYSGTHADLPLLALADKPVATAPEHELEVAAAEHDLPMLAFQPRTLPSGADYVRTFAAFGGLIAGSLFGVLVEAHTRRRRPMADSLMRYGTAATLRLARVRVTVTGQQHAHNPRPAVFVFNHQSQFDVIIVPAVLEGGVTGIGKKELTRNPVFGPLMRFVGVTFIDRADPTQAKASLAPVVDTLCGGLSIAIAPEGTRSYTPEVGRFKKGAFHIARQAGVPVIPVVIRNAGELAWRNSMVVRPGTIDVAIGAPIDVRDWDSADMHDEVEAVRQLFIDTLLDWPQ